MDPVKDINYQVGHARWSELLFETKKVGLNQKSDGIYVSGSLEFLLQKQNKGPDFTRIIIANKKKTIVDLREGLIDNMVVFLGTGHKTRKVSKENRCI